jgi:hypothetical protein
MDVPRVTFLFFLLLFATTVSTRHETNEPVVS